MRGSQGNASQEETFYVSKDGQKIIRGTVFDLDQNPFKPDLDKIKTEYQPSIGTPGAPVVLVEFSDFECPYCREQAKMLHDNLLTAYPKEVRLYYLDFPLETLHPWAKSAAMMGRCIFHQNASAFWDYHDWIFQHQEEITPDNLKDKVLEFAKGKGIDGRAAFEMHGYPRNRRGSRQNEERRARLSNSTPRPLCSLTAAAWSARSNGPI